ncbi:DNA (cytosine-5-)-methyltransferase [candidate division WOR-3 bacterium]|nr:DNA (cytosine-5-)-methyltransferase [candidate division WOR-3 bacterium]
METGLDDSLSFIDLFCGIGGFRLAGEEAGWRCVFSCDIDPEAQRAYQANFGEMPEGDIRKIDSSVIPDHDILLAGFPCQPFSIIGDRKGFDDTRGTLFFEIARIISAKKPQAFVLENVKQLATHHRGGTLHRILEVLRGLGYFVDYRILNALNFGLPQKRERIFIVGTKGSFNFKWPKGGKPMRPLDEILENEVAKKYYVSDYIKTRRLTKHQSRYSPAIWHENKSGNISSYPYSCALRAGASYNYLLVDGIRRLTPREMLRLQGFPDSFKIVCNDSQTRRQAGNAVPVPIVKAVLSELKCALDDKRIIRAPERTPYLGVQVDFLNGRA